MFWLSIILIILLAIFLLFGLVFSICLLLAIHSLNKDLEKLNFKFDENDLEKTSTLET